MAERDLPSRLRRAVKENNLFLVKRLIQRTDMRNPDPSYKRFTSLAWAAVLGHEETFEFLLSSGHDQEQLSRDSDNDTILILLAETKGTAVTSPTYLLPEDRDPAAALRMARIYVERYPDVLDWSNYKGRTALHVAALKGNEELVQMLIDLGADFDLPDNEGNTPLHYASAWGHIPIVQLLIEGGCQYVAKNNEGFSASDFAYTLTTKETLESTARAQYDLHRMARRQVFVQAAARGGEMELDDLPSPPPAVPPKQRGPFAAALEYRNRSGSGASRSTATSDSGEPHDTLRKQPSYSSLSTTSSPSHNSNHPVPGSLFPRHQAGGQTSGSNSTLHSPGQSQSSLLHPPVSTTGGSALTPIASRMREADATAMANFAMDSFMKTTTPRPRNRSDSAETGSTQNGSVSYGNGGQPPDSNFVSAGPSANGDDITALGSVAPRRRLRPSASASQLNAQAASNAPRPSEPSATASRTRSGTGPEQLTLETLIKTRPSGLTPPADRALFNSPVQTSPSNPRPSLSRGESSDWDRSAYTGPSREYARFPEPPGESKTPTQSTSNGRRLPFSKLTKGSNGSVDQTPPPAHRRGGSGSITAQLAAVRGGT